MAYKKPEIVAKSAAKETFVAGCPEKNIVYSGGCSSNNSKCFVGDLK